jgi:hypothetical protein
MAAAIKIQIALIRNPISKAVKLTGSTTFLAVQ